jgi:hypothetical protein
MEDMAEFKLLRSEEKPNVSRFVNLLFQEYYVGQGLYVQKKEKYHNSIAFRLTKENAECLKAIEAEELGSDKNYSDFFRMIFEKYALKPKYQRERIIFSGKYNKMFEAIEQRCQVRLNITRSDGSSFNTIFLPYTCVATKEEKHNYWIGLNENRVYRAVKLSSIVSVHPLKSKSDFSVEEIAMFRNVVELRDPFSAIATDITIRLTKRGRKMFQDISYNRPEAIMKDGLIYRFHCSAYRIELYFFRFGAEAEILEPADLRTDFRKKYEAAWKQYD